MEDEKRLNIAFLTARDPRDKGTWSGTYYFMIEALQKHCGDVCCLGPVNPTLPRLQEKTLNLIDRASRISLGKIYNYEHSIFISQTFSKIFNSKLLEHRCDLILAPSASTEIAFLKAKVPIVYLSDVTFALIDDYYSSFSNFVNDFEGNIIEKLAMRKADLLLYPSAWAAHSAIKDYRAAKEKVHIVPFGANLENVPAKEVVLGKKKSDKCRLLFLGVDWNRKGGEIAFEALLELEKLGLKSELIVCGCTPPKEFSHEMMTVIPLLDKRDKDQFRELENLLLSSDFLFLPTRAECFGLVFCEASAYGLPSITTNTGGVSGAVKDGENGFMLSPSARGADYAKLIYEVYQDDQRYYDLVKSSRKAFDERLNWDTWAIKFKELVTEKLL